MCKLPSLPSLRQTSLQIRRLLRPRAVRWLKIFLAAGLAAAGFANVMCAAVFITGLDPDFAAENVGYFVSPYEIRAKLGKPVIDRAAKSVHVKLSSGIFHVPGGGLTGGTCPAVSTRRSPIRTPLPAEAF